MKSYIKFILILFSLTYCINSFSQEVGHNDFSITNYEGVNTEDNEVFLSYFYDNYLVFGSLKGEGKPRGIIYDNGLKLDFGYELYIVDQTDVKYPKKFFILDDKVSSKDEFIGGIHAPYFNQDFTVMYYGKNVCKKKTKERRIFCNLRLYRAKTNIGKSEYSVLDEPLSVNVEGRNSAYPAFDEDARYLYFVSDGYNKPSYQEIVVTKVQSNGSLGIVRKVKGLENMGNKYTSLFIKNSTLYFSSNRDGDLDIYKAPILTYDKVGEVEKMPEPLNLDDADDFSYIFKDSENEALFSSNRDNPMNFDIYKYKKYPLVDVEGIVYDDNTQKPIDNVVIIITDEDNNMIKQTVSSKDGSYKLKISSKSNYKIIFSKDKYEKLTEKLLLKYIVDSGLPYVLNIAMSNQDRNIEGIVTDSQNNPIIDGVIVVSSQGGGLIGTTQTDSKGRYKMTLKKSFAYDMKISKPGFLEENTSIDYNDLKIGKNTFNFEIKEDKGGSETTTVYVYTKGSDNPIEEALVLVYDKENDEVAHILRTDSQGEVIIPVPKKGSVKISISKDGFKPIKENVRATFKEKPKKESRKKRKKPKKEKEERKNQIRFELEEE